MFIDDFDDCTEYDELVAQRRFDRQRARAFINHPDPSDPDYAGDEDDDEQI